MSKYILIGITNCGKSALGRRAAEILQMPFHQISDMASGRLDLENPAELFMLNGMGRLLDEQFLVMGELAELDGSAIIEVWPEIPLLPKFARVLNQMGTVIHIRRDTELALASINENNEPVMHEAKTDWKMSLQVLSVMAYAQELPRFEALADLTLDNNGSEDEAVEKLVAMIKKRESLTSIYRRVAVHKKTTIFGIPLPSVMFGEGCCKFFSGFVSDVFEKAMERDEKFRALLSDDSTFDHICKGYVAFKTCSTFADISPELIINYGNGMYSISFFDKYTGYDRDFVAERDKLFPLFGPAIDGIVSIEQTGTAEPRIVNLRERFDVEMFTGWLEWRYVDRLFGKINVPFGEDGKPYLDDKVLSKILAMSEYYFCYLPKREDKSA